MKKLKILLPVMAMLAVGVAGFTGSEAKVANAAGSTVTYTIASATSVTTSGTAPSGSSADFKNTYTNNKQQLTKNNSMTLTLSGYQGYKVTGITLRMRSNKSAGTGSFEAKAGSTVISSISTAAFNNSKWNGSYSDSFVDVKPTISNPNYVIGSGENLTLKIAATANSLYCEKFTINYEAGAVEGPTTYTATFNASPAKFVNSADSSMTVGAEEATVTLPTADKLVNNGLFYAGTAHVTGWKGADGTTYALGANVSISGITAFTAIHQQDRSEITAAEATAIAKETGTTASLYQYTVSGTVTAITNAYNSTYKSVGVTIKDVNGDTINAYGMKSADSYDISKLRVGANVTVTGNLINYESKTPQFNINCTAVVHLDDILAPTNLAYDNDTYTLSWDEVTGAEAYSLVITGSEGEVVNEVLTETSYNIASLLDDTYNVEVVALGDPTHKDSEVAAIEFTKVAPATETVQFVETKASLGFGYNKTVTGDAEVATYTAKYTGSATTNMNADGKDEAATLNLSGTGIEVIADAGGASNNPGLNKDGSLRLYHDSTGSNYIQFISEKTIASIKVEYTAAANSNGKVSLDNSKAIEGIADSNNSLIKTYEIGNKSFYIGHNLVNTTQVRIKYIEINVGSQETSWEFGNVRMRFQATVASELYSRLNAEAAGFEVTAAGSDYVDTIDCTASVGTNADGDRYIIGSITQIPETAYNTVLTAKAFFTVAGEKVYLQEVSYSVATLVEEYLTTYYDSLDAEAKEAITAFSETL